MKALSGFFWCDCGKMHTFYPWSTWISCNCGRTINQYHLLDKEQEGL